MFINCLSLKRRINNILKAGVFAWLLLTFSCIEPYEPPVIGEDHRFLVVEGFLPDQGDGPYIKLSRTARLADSAMIMPERYAQVQLEGTEQGQIYLRENSQGHYSLGHYQLREGQEYRLRIHTSNGSEYLSEPIGVKRTPPIDSLSWARTDKGLQIYVNTHDPENATTYYRWDYEETWEFDSEYFSFLEYVNDEIVNRNFDEEDNGIYTCWQSSRSRTIELGSSAKLSEDIIYRQPLAFIPENSWKLSKKYSILVRQYALRKEAFEYFQQIKKNSELGGDIFAPQPTELNGNMHCLDKPNELVVGFVSAYAAQEYRIFIDKVQVPNWRVDNGCELMAVEESDADEFFGERGFIPLSYDMIEGIYFTSANLCIDCTRRGRAERPAFWE